MKRKFIQLLHTTPTLVLFVVCSPIFLLLSMLYGMLYYYAMRYVAARK